MKAKTLFLFVAVTCFIQPLMAGVKVYELYPNIRTIGIMLVLDAPIADSATSLVEYEEYTGGTWSPVKQGLELSRVTDYQYAGCIFWTKPYAQYRVHVKLMDGNTLIADLTSTVTTRKEVSSVNATRTFYVSPAGTGISQSFNMPGKLEQNLLDSLKPGDKVKLLPGTYYAGELELKSSGTEQNPIVFEGGFGVIIDGSIATPITWKRVSSDTANRDYNMFYANLGALNTNCIVVGNKRMYPYRNTYELSLFQTIRSIDGNGYIQGNYPIGLSGFFRDGRNPSGNFFPYVGYNNNTYIKFADGSDTTGKSIKVSTQVYAFRGIGKNNIQFKGINFKYFGCAKQLGYRSALFFDNCDSLLVDTCHFEFCDRGIIFRGNSDNNIVQRSRFDDDFGDWSYFQFKETNEDYQHLNTNYPNFFPFKHRYIETGRIYFDHGYTGRGNIIRRNVFNGGCDGITCPDTPGDSTTCRNFDIYENEFMHGSDDAFEVDGNASNVRVWGNIMHGTGNGISSSSPCYGPLYVMRNVIYDLHSSPYEYITQDLFGYHLYSDTPRASPIKLNAAYCDIPGKVYFMHNTCDVGLDSYGFLAFQPQAQSSWSNFVSRNNIFYNESNFYTLWVRAMDKVDLDYNNYYCTQTFTARKDRNGYGVYNSLQQASANILNDVNKPNSFIEPHGYQINPAAGWVNEAAHDYHLIASSNMIDSGIYIAGMNDGFYGAAPDLGAFEFHSLITQRDTVNDFTIEKNTHTIYTDSTFVVVDSSITDTITLSAIGVTCDTTITGTATLIDSVVTSTVDTVFVTYTITQVDTMELNCVSLTTHTVYVPVVIIGLNDIAGEALKIYPNPNSGRFVVEAGAAGIDRIVLMDLSGRVVYSSNSSGNINSYVLQCGEQLVSGVYLLKVQTEGGVFVRRVVVE